MAIIRHEINCLNSACVTGSYYYWVRLTTTSYSGTCTWYLEVCSKTVASGTTVTLLDSTGNTHATVSFNETEVTVKRVQFSTPPTTDSYRLNISTDSSVYTVKIICLQDTGDSCTGSETQIELGDSMSTNSISAIPMTNPKYFTYNSANWDGTIAAYLETDLKSDNASGTCYLVLQQDDGNWANWADITSLSVTGTSISRMRSNNIFSSLISGRHCRVAIYSNNSSYNAFVYLAKLIFIQTNTITKLEETQFIMITGDSGSTGLQVPRTKYNSSDWAGSAVTYKYSHDATNASDASQLYNVTDSEPITSVITGANQQVSDNFNAPTDGDVLGVNVTDTTGAVCYGRLLAIISLGGINLTAVQHDNHIDLSWIG